MASLVIFSSNVPRLAAFYEAILGATPMIESSGDIRLFTQQDEVLIHSIPAKIAKTIQISVPPVPRDEAAIKPGFEVDALDLALERVRANGGVVTTRNFVHNGVARHDVLDSDGNVITLRSLSLDH